ncbi:MAG: 50S ribosomal protein L9 [Anaerolineae bacterium]|nr:50S ribosomal protein L9 [Anaerolineae bacterium]MDW8070285.1 50S ribosomal protein L9 [Anaerolineae bacterium]
MKVLLLEDVENLGQAGSVVSVADGYARNFLIPRKLARSVTEGSLKELEILRQAAERKRQRQLNDAQELARRLDGLTLTFRARAGEKGKLYGSITTADLAAALQERIGHAIDRRKIVTQPLRQLGQHEVEIHLMANVVARINVVIEPEEAAEAETAQSASSKN